MNIKEAIAKIDLIISSLDAELQKASEEFAMSALGLVVNRIQQEGIPGRKYSTNKLPAFWFEDKALNGGGRALVEKHMKKKERAFYKMVGEKVRNNKAIDEMENGISYDEWRQANGLQVNHVDLTFSGRMMQNLGVLGTKRNGNIWVTVIGGTNAEVIMKLEYTTKMFGKWLKPTDQEKDLLQMQFQKRIDDFLNRLAA